MILDYLKNKEPDKDGLLLEDYCNIEFETTQEFCDILGHIFPVYIKDASPYSSYYLCLKEEELIKAKEEKEILFFLAKHFSAVMNVFGYATEILDTMTDFVRLIPIEELNFIQFPCNETEEIVDGIELICKSMSLFQLKECTSALIRMLEECNHPYFPTELLNSWKEKYL